MKESQVESKPALEVPKPLRARARGADLTGKVSEGPGRSDVIAEVCRESSSNQVNVPGRGKIVQWWRDS